MSIRNEIFDTSNELFIKLMSPWINIESKKTHNILNGNFNDNPIDIGKYVLKPE